MNENLPLTFSNNSGTMTGEKSLGFALPLSDSELERFERQLIPLLNTIRQLRGKKPVIVPADRRVHT